jgi:GNAT superfamily N-acetyltransferase
VISVGFATIDDAEGILQCLRAAFEDYRDRYTPQAYEDTVLTPDALYRRLQTMTVLVAKDDSGAVVGTIGGSAHEEEGHLRGMAVLPDRQGQGVAQQLLDRIEQELTAAGCKVVSLDTTTPLLRAMAFYERNGYRPSGMVTDFFGMPLHEYRKLLR